MDERVNHKDKYIPILVASYDNLQRSICKIKYMLSIIVITQNTKVFHTKNSLETRIWNLTRVAKETDLLQIPHHSPIVTIG